MAQGRQSWLIQDAFERFKRELEGLITNCPVIAAKINARTGEGDVAENGGYQAVRKEQGWQEARIRILRELVRTSQVGQTPPYTGLAQPGMVLTVRLFVTALMARPRRSRWVLARSATRRAKTAVLEEALTGHFEDHQRLPAQGGVGPHRLAERPDRRSRPTDRGGDRPFRLGSSPPG